MIRSLILIQIFGQVTQNMSVKGVPTLPWVLPMYEHMHKSLVNIVNEKTTLSSLRYGAQAGLQKLDSYYKKAKTNQFYVLGVGVYIYHLYLNMGLTYANAVCHPSLRFEWFRMNTDIDRREAAEVLFNYVYEQYAGSMPQPVAPAHAAPLVPKRSSDFLSEIAGVNFNTLPDAHLSATRSELERYSLFEGGCGDH